MATVKNKNVYVVKKRYSDGTRFVVAVCSSKQKANAIVFELEIPDSSTIYYVSKCELNTYDTELFFKI